MSDKDSLLGDNFWLYLWTIFSITLVTLVLGAYIIRAKHVEKMAELGYEERQEIGSCETIWVRSAE